MPEILDILSSLFSPGEAEAAGARAPSVQMQMLQDPSLRQRMQEMKLQEQAAQIMLREVMRQQAAQQDPMKQLQLQRTQQQVTAGAEKARPQPSIAELLGGRGTQSSIGTGTTMFLPGGQYISGAGPDQTPFDPEAETIFRGKTPDTGTPYFTNYPEGLPAWVSPEERQQFTQRFESTRAKGPQTIEAKGIDKAVERATLAAQLKGRLPDKELENLLEARYGQQIPEGVTGEDALATVEPRIATIAKKLANYEMPWPGSMALRNPEWQKVLQAAVAYDPTFDSTKYAARQKLRQDFASGKNANNLRSLNTAVAHLDTLSRAGQALQNADYPLWNAIANRGLQAIGDPRVTAFNNAATAVESELANVFKGTGATDQEIKQWRQNLSNTQSPAQISSAINTAVELLRGRMDALGDIWEKTMGKSPNFSLLSPKATQTIENLGTVSTQAPSVGGLERKIRKTGTTKAYKLLPGASMPAGWEEVK